MFDLYHVRLCNPAESDVNLLFTATSEEAARAKAVECINPIYRGDYEVKRCEVVCKTPDVVDYYEPV